jgi:hypothetical protein
VLIIVEQNILNPLIKILKSLFVKIVDHSVLNVMIIANAKDVKVDFMYCKDNVRNVKMVILLKIPYVLIALSLV